jgi:quercetin dioxygenase-like cupin family protein
MPPNYLPNQESGATPRRLPQQVAQANILDDEERPMNRVREQDLPYRNGDWGVKYLFRGPKIDWGVVLLKPGQAMGAHGHREVEESFYVMEGEGKLLVNDVPNPARRGDAFTVAPFEKHDILNDGDSEMKVVFIKAPYLPEDKISY